MRVSIVETFVSVQGEGPSVGEPAVFLRLAGCNLACTWCDTPYSWDWVNHNREELVEQVEALELIERLVEFVPPSVSLLVITGGEPLAQRTGLVSVIQGVLSRRPNLRVEIETNGSIPPTASMSDSVHLYVVSPKLRNAGTLNVTHAGDVARFAGLRSVLKFVVRTAGDVDEAESVALSAGFDRSRVWLSPEGVDPATISRHGQAIAPRAIEKGFRVSPRLHIAIWGDLRGR